MRMSRMCLARGGAEKFLGRGACIGIGSCFRTLWHTAPFGGWCWAAKVCAGCVLFWSGWWRQCGVMVLYGSAVPPV